jgi:predicted metal-binding protein
VIICPACSEDTELRRNESVLCCEACGHRWSANTKNCATCAGTDLVSRARPLTQYSRGTQLSIVGWVDVDCCVICDADALDKAVAAGGPLPSDYEPAARTRRIG